MEEAERCVTPLDARHGTHPFLSISLITVLCESRMATVFSQEAGKCGGYPSVSTEKHLMWRALAQSAHLEHLAWHRQPLLCVSEPAWCELFNVC